MVGRRLVQVVANEPHEGGIQAARGPPAHEKFLNRGHTDAHVLRRPEQIHTGLPTSSFRMPSWAGTVAA